MRKKFGISFIAIAILIVLISGTIPHHHHENGVVCFFMAHCENDHAEEHTDQKQHSCHHASSCIVDANYTNPQNEVKIKTPLCDNCDNSSHFHLFPIYYLVSDFVIPPNYNTYTKPKQRDHFLFYTSAEIGRIHGLRAPPFSLS